MTHQLHYISVQIHNHSIITVHVLYDIMHMHRWLQGTRAHLHAFDYDAALTDYY